MQKLRFLHVLFNDQSNRWVLEVYISEPGHEPVFSYSNGVLRKKTCTSWLAIAWIMELFNIYIKSGKTIDLSLLIQQDYTFGWSSRLCERYSHLTSAGPYFIRNAINNHFSDIFQKPSIIAAASGSLTTK